MSIIFQIKVIDLKGQIKLLNPRTATTEEKEKQQDSNEMLFFVTPHGEYFG